MKKAMQLSLEYDEDASGSHLYSAKKEQGNNGANRLDPTDRPAHDWYRFVLSYPPHLVRDYIERFALHRGHRVLDPFCGTGTTIVECKKHGIPSVGIEASKMAHFASEVKIDWSLDPDALVEHAQSVAADVLRQLKSEGISDIPPVANGVTGSAAKIPLRTIDEDLFRLLLTDSISPLPLHKTLALIDALHSEHHGCFYRHEALALAKALIGPIGNLHFGPEVGVGVIKSDAPVIASWLKEVRSIANDLRQLRELEDTPALVHYADARHLSSCLEPHSVDAVITSPPYPNEKDYTRTTRLESVLLGLISSREDLRRMKKSLIRSNTRGVYKEDDDDRWSERYPEVNRIAECIEARRIELGKTSGFERLYARVTKLYFGGMARHLSELQGVLRPNAQLAYVVGDQASYLRVMIRTGEILASIADSLGYEIVGIDLFRTRLATATKEHLREEVVVLRWKG